MNELVTQRVEQEERGVRGEPGHTLITRKINVHSPAWKPDEVLYETVESEEVERAPVTIRGFARYHLRRLRARPAILFCPECGAKHVDEPEPGRGWTNPPHRKHLCHSCGHLWRPFDHDTYGVHHVTPWALALYHLARLKVRVKFYPRDFWIGAYFDDESPKLVVCLVPMFPLIITWGEPKRGSRFQYLVGAWLVVAFDGMPEATSPRERNFRFLEEALELVQACGLPKEDALKLLDYTYGRPPGEVAQEVGGTLTTLAALCLAQNVDMDEAGEAELRRCWQNAARIRAKQMSKVRDTPLPGAA